MLNQTINQTAAVDSVVSYASTLPDYLMAGNIVAIIISLILFFILIIVLNAISKLLLVFLKRSILFIIIVLVMVDFFPRYLDLVSAEGWTFNVILIGLLSVIASLSGLYIATKSLIKSAREHLFRASKQLQKTSETEHAKYEKDVHHTLMQNQQENISEMWSRASLHNEKSIFAVLVYLIVAEFGVFSSPTLSAPTIQVGLMFFAVFLVGVLIFMKSSYKNLKTATMYFTVTFIVGVGLSFALGVLWGKSTLPELLSAEFFTSDSLVAMITGMGVSLFAGSKG